MLGQWDQTGWTSRKMKKENDSEGNYKLYTI